MAAIDARPVPRKNAAFRYYFTIRKNDGTLITTWAGMDSQVSIDGGAFAACTSEAIEIGTTGCGYLDLTAGEMNGDAVLLKVTVTNTSSLTVVVTFFPEESGDYRADAVMVSGDSVAADNAESFFDGTGYAGTNNVIPTVTTATTATNLTNLPTAPTDWLSSAAVSAGAVTKIQAGLATPTNITGGTITTVTNLTNAASAGDLTATMKASVTTAVPTAIANATAVWQDATAGDFTTANSIGKSLYNAFTANTSVYTVGALANAPTGGSAPTAAAIATAVWTDLLAGSDFSTVASVGKLIKDDVDAKLSTLSTYAGGDTTGTTTLLDRLTSGRAGNLDNLDVMVSTRLSIFDYTIMNPTPAAIASNVWFHLLSDPDFSTAGSIGKLLKDDIDTKLSTLSTYAGGDTAGTTTLLSRVTGTRSGYLDNLSAGVVPTAAINAAATWDLATFGHTTSGTFGASMNAAGSAGDPWGTSLPGAYGAGTAGKLVGDNLDAKVSTRLDSAAAGTAQTGDVFGLVNPMIVSSVFTGASLANALEAIPLTEPTVAADGAMSTWSFRKLMRWLVARMANASKTPTALTVKKLGGTTMTTQVVADDGAGTESTGVPS